MPSITTAEVKTILKLSDTDYDTTIAALIPLVERDLCEYLNNWFIDRHTQFDTASFRFYQRTTTTGATRSKLTDSVNKQFLQYGFTDTMDVAIDGSWRNHGIYSISSVADSVIKFTTGSYNFTKEYSTDFYTGSAIRINRVRWPESLKVHIAHIIWYNIERRLSFGLNGRTIGTNNISYESLSGGQYPPSIMFGLRRWKNIKLK